MPATSTYPPSRFHGGAKPLRVAPEPAARQNLRWHEELRFFARIYVSGFIVCLALIG